MTPECSFVDGGCQVIELDPSSPLGYKRKYVALRGAGHHQDASDAFRMMLSMISESSKPEIRSEGYKLRLNPPTDYAL